MAKKSIIQEKLSRATYDKRNLHKGVLDFKKSFDEVSSIINGKNKKQDKK